MRCWVLLSVLASCGVVVQKDDPTNKFLDAGPRGVDSAPPPPPCTGGDARATAPDASCLVLFTGTYAWMDAQAACSAIGAHLAILRSATMDHAAEQLVGAIDAFIGLTDQVSEGTFLWADGSPVSFTNWRAGEPSEGDGGGGYSEDCAVIAGTRSGGGWEDRPCAPIPGIGGGNYAALCQR